MLILCMYAFFDTLSFHFTCFRCYMVFFIFCCDTLKIGDSYAEQQVRKIDENMHQLQVSCMQTGTFLPSLQVSDFTWSHDGTQALIAYRDGFVLVGSVSGQRHWSSEINLESQITCGIWTPDDQQVHAVPLLSVSTALRLFQPFLVGFTALCC